MLGQPTHQFRVQLGRVARGVGVGEIIEQFRERWTRDGGVLAGNGFDRGAALRKFQFVVVHRFDKTPIDRLISGARNKIAAFVAVTESSAVSN